MKKAWIIVNQFLKTKKFTELYEYFEIAMLKRNIALDIYTNAEVLSFLFKDWDMPSFVIFWDKDIRLAKLMESMGFKLFNSASAIEICDDKYLTYLALKKAGVPTPETLPVPMTFSNTDYSDFDFLDEYIKILGLPMVVKENFGSFGEQVYLAKTKDEALKIIIASERKPLIFQKFIESSFGRDVRINIVGDRIVAAIERYSDCGDFRANLSIGGKMKNFTPDSECEKLALAASEAAGLNFCGVDLLYTEKGYTVCEINSNAHFKNIMELTGINFAENIVEYIEATI